MLIAENCQGRVGQYPHPRGALSGGARDAEAGKGPARGLKG